MYDTSSQRSHVSRTSGGCAGAPRRASGVTGASATSATPRGTTRCCARTSFRVQTDGGDTTRSPQGDANFVLVATTADLATGSGTTVGHRVYMVNLYARPPAPVTSNVVWFPTQGIPPL
jgi:hypothetical protein